MALNLKCSLPVPRSRWYLHYQRLLTTKEVIYLSRGEILQFYNSWLLLLLQSPDPRRMADIFLKLFKIGFSQLDFQKMRAFVSNPTICTRIQWSNTSLFIHSNCWVSCCDTEILLDL